MPVAPLILTAALSLGLFPLPLVQAQSDGRVLVFSRTTVYRHASIPDGIAALQAIGTVRGFSVTATENPAFFSDSTLSVYDAVVFLNTTGDVLDSAQQTALETYIRRGGGFVGIHAAADTEYGWPWYGGLVGAYFESHPPGTPGAVVRVVDRVHPATASLPATWTRTDEWYNFRTNPRGAVHVLATLDERTYSGGTMGGDHPIAWCHAYEGGRSFYTAGGHTSEAFHEPLFRDHLWGGLAWAAGWVEGNCSATVGTSWEQSMLDTDVNDPMELAVAPDGRVFFVERAGAVKVWHPQRNQTTRAATLAVTTANEDGLLGITLDPDFERTGWVYLYYSPAGPAPVQHLSRFTVTGDILDLASEVVLLTVPTDREQGGHSGGSLAFGPDGLLYLATGDDTDPFASDGYAPIDERPGRAAWDAQHTSANPYDLRGKILRMRPLVDGTIAIPEGNLFPADGTQGRPEIFAMGARNPFRISVDPMTGWLYWGDVGPDATSANPARGPRGYDELNQARTAGFFGWPYCIADNLPYRDYDFATGVSGPAFDCTAPVNASVNVPQAPVDLPAAQSAWAWYPYASSPEFPDLPDGPGRTIMAGPMIRRDVLRGDAHLPAYFDGAVFFYEWSRNWIIETHLDEEGQPLAFQRFLPDLVLHRPMDLELGPDGALYMLEWGTGGGNNPDAALSRITYVSGSRAPVVRARATPTSGPVPLTASFSSLGTYHPEGLPLSYAWDLDGDGSTDATTQDAIWTYTDRGTTHARLTVTDTNGRSASATLSIVAGNAAPVVEVTTPANGGFYAWGDLIPFEVSATDAEDGSTRTGSIDCALLVVQPGIGHDDHNHPLAEYPGCTGSFEAPIGHGTDEENVFLFVEARYTDRGATGAGALTGRHQVMIRPKRLEAEHFAHQAGVYVEMARDGSGGANVGGIEEGDWLAFEPVHLQGIDFITFHVASVGSGGRIEVRLDAPDGPLLATARISLTNAGQAFKEVTVPIMDPGGTHTLYLIFRNERSTNTLFSLDWLRFHGAGVATPPAVPEGLVAEYFPSPDLSGTPTVRIDPQVSFDWGTDAPLNSFPTSGFSVRWRGQLRVPASGLYRFSTATDDGARLWVNGQHVVDAWEDTGFRRQSGSVMLPAGDLPIRLEYRDLSRTAEATLLWTGPDFLLQTVPQERLIADPESAMDAESVVAAAPLSLLPPHPNPIRNTVELAFRLPHPARATLELFDMLGRRVMLLLDGPTTAGHHAVRPDLSALASGVYVVRLTTGGSAVSRLLTIVH